MSYLVDTDWVAEHLKGRAPAIDVLPALALAGLSISLITVGEIYGGIYFGRHPEGKEAGFRKVPTRCARVAAESGDHAPVWPDAWGTAPNGQRIGDPDLLIAATALHHDRFLVTRNTGHFQRIAGLKLHRHTPAR